MRWSWGWHLTGTCALIWTLRESGHGFHLIKSTFLNWFSQTVCHFLAETMPKIGSVAAKLTWVVTSTKYLIYLSFLPRCLAFHSNNFSRKPSSCASTISATSTMPTISTTWSPRPWIDKRIYVSAAQPRKRKKFKSRIKNSWPTKWNGEAEEKHSHSATRIQKVEEAKQGSLYDSLRNEKEKAEKAKAPSLRAKRFFFEKS